MGYFKDAFGIILLKNDAYKKVGNDRKSFLRLLFAWLTSFYILFSLFGILIYFLTRKILAEKYAIPDSLIFILVIIFLIFPILLFFLQYIATLIPHWIGLAFGGKPRNFKDFFTINNYIIPLLFPLSTIFRYVVSTVWIIWCFVILYKSYRIIHKLDEKKAAGAVVVNILLYLVFIFIIMLIIAWFFGNNPALLASLQKK